MFYSENFRVGRTAAAIAGVAATTMLFLAAEAAAHATLEKRTATIGGTYKAVMRIAHGCEGQATHTVRVKIPERYYNVKPMPKPGWTVTTRRAPYAKTYTRHGRKYSEGVVEITWSKGHVPDDFFDEFVFRGSIGDAEAGSTLYFPTTQICTKGELAWDQIPQPGQTRRDLEHPAPELALMAKMKHGGHAMAGHGVAKGVRIADLAIDGIWARASHMKGGNSAAYLSIRNSGKHGDRLIGASAVIAKKVEIHNHINDGGIMRMRPVDGVDVPAGGMAMLKPGGYHVMIMGLKGPLKEGTKFAMTLKFEKSGRVDVQVPVKSSGAMRHTTHGN